MGSRLNLEEIGFQVEVKVRSQFSVEERRVRIAVKRIG